MVGKILAKQISLRLSHFFFYRNILDSNTLPKVQSPGNLCVQRVPEVTVIPTALQNALKSVVSVFPMFTVPGCGSCSLRRSGNSDKLSPNLQLGSQGCLSWMEEPVQDCSIIAVHNSSESKLLQRPADLCGPQSQIRLFAQIQCYEVGLSRRYSRTETPGFVASQAVMPCCYILE